MSSALMPAPSLALPSLPSRALLRNAAAAMVAVGLHGVVLGLLLSQWPSDTPEPPQVRTLTTRLISLAPPAPPPPEVVVAAAPAVAVEPVKPREAPKPDPRLQQQKLEQAALARKRVQEQKRDSYVWSSNARSASASSSSALNNNVRRPSCVSSRSSCAKPSYWLRPPSGLVRPKPPRLPVASTCRLPRTRQTTPSVPSTRVSKATAPSAIGSTRKAG